MSKILGISEGSHDAAWCLIKDGEILTAHHAERSTRVKNQKWITHIPWWCRDAVFVGHEDKERVAERRKEAGQDPQPKNIDYNKCYNHYETHAWAGWATAPFDECDILCIDAIGEKETAAVYRVRDDGFGNTSFEKTWEMKYPMSYGLAYSAVTAGLGYKPMEEEYIVMGLAAYGEPRFYKEFYGLYQQNCHKGIELPQGRPEDIAASIQWAYETWLFDLVNTHCRHKNLILMGGCALNCVANSKIYEGRNIWIMPNPGDAGSSLGAAARHYGSKLNWKGPYLGTNIQRNVNPREVASYLSANGVAGVANGRAEFGPRALGNRSLLADPRLDIKDTVNDIKRRQRFRPFAPAILEEHSTKFFSGPMNEYMQFVATALHDYDSVTHVDGTARVQVVKPDCQSVIRPILEEWYELTGCPMLLNTSLNIKGEPMVDTLEHAEEWEKKYQVRVF
jgi:carbamoyltransferase